MSTVIVITNQNLEAYVAEVRAYLDAKYHTYPDVFWHLYIEPDIEAQLSQYNAMANSFDVGETDAAIGSRVY